MFKQDAILRALERALKGKGEPFAVSVEGESFEEMRRQLVEIIFTDLGCRCLAYEVATKENACGWFLKGDDLDGVKVVVVRVLLYEKDGVVHIQITS